MQPADSHTNDVERLYRLYGPALLLFAVTVAGERDRAQDAVHQVFGKLLETASLPRALDMKAYLFASVRNAVLNEVRVQRRNLALDSDVAWFSPPDRDYAAELRLRRALCALPGDQREVMVLHIWGELTFAEIGHVLSISANTAASRYRYALGKLREAMSAKESSCAQP